MPCDITSSLAATCGFQSRLSTWLEVRLGVCSCAVWTSWRIHLLHHLRIFPCTQGIRVATNLQDLVPDVLLLVRISRYRSYRCKVRCFTRQYRASSLRRRFWENGSWSTVPFIYGSYWFITAYICLLLLAPFINCLFKYLPRQYMTALIALLSFFSVWILLGGRTTPWNNVVYAILGYVTGGWIRLYWQEVNDKIRTWHLWGIIIFSTSLMIIFNHYAADRTWLATILGWPEQIKPGIQILPMLIGAALFILFTKLDMTNIQGFGHALVLKTASATFGIYLIHENTFWYRLIWPSIANILPFPDSLFSTASTALIITLVVFVMLGIIAILFDTIFVHPLTKFIVKCVQKWK